MSFPIKVIFNASNPPAVTTIPNMPDSNHVIPRDETESTVPVLTLSYDHSINYAFQQNAIPVVKELHFKNDATPRKHLVIRASTEPAFAAPVEIRLQGIDAEGEFQVAPLDFKLSHDFLAGLNERIPDGSRRR
jgi:hypothetical protein